MEHFVKNIEITNFKSIRHAEVKDCRRVNVFVGYPNVGKSNILEAMSLFNIGELADSDLRQYLRFENYANLFFNNNFRVGIEVKLENLERIELKLSNKELQLRSESSSMFFEMEIPLNEFEVNSMAHGSKASDGYDSLQRLQIKKYSFNSKIKDNLISYSWQLSFPSGKNLSEVISSNQILKKEVIEIFKRYNLKYAIDEKNNIKIIKEYGDQEVKIFPYLQMADTLKRLIFYKAVILSNKNSILLLEEPESHMFPPYISKMTGDIIYDENNNQFFIATHSPYVLGDLIRDVEPNELSIYIVGYDAAKGETIIHRMNDEEVNEAYQFGHDFFMNINNFIPNTQHEQV